MRWHCPNYKVCLDFILFFLQLDLYLKNVRYPIYEVCYLSWHWNHSPITKWNLTLKIFLGGHPQTPPPVAASLRVVAWTVLPIILLLTAFILETPSYTHHRYAPASRHRIRNSRSEAEHATSRSLRLPTILNFTREWGRNILFLSIFRNRRDREPNPEL